MNSFSVCKMNLYDDEKNYIIYVKKSDGYSMSKMENIIAKRLLLGDVEKKDADAYLLLDKLWGDKSVDILNIGIDTRVVESIIDLEVKYSINLYNECINAKDNKALDRIRMKKFKQYIIFGKLYNVDITKYVLNLNYNYKQIQMIYSCMYERFDASLLDSPEFNHQQMWNILNGLRRGVDISIYANPRYDFMQMIEILSGLGNNEDVSSYCDTKYDYRQMHYIRWGNKNGVDFKGMIDDKKTEEELHRKYLKTRNDDNYDFHLEKTREEDFEWERTSFINTNGIRSLAAPFI